MARSQKSCRRHTPPDAQLVDLYDYAATRNRVYRRAAKRPSPTWSVTDDWPEDVPVTDDEIVVFEAWFGDLFDALFGDG
jgi:hypothetical protein